MIDKTCCYFETIWNFSIVMVGGAGALQGLIMNNFRYIFIKMRKHVVVVVIQTFIGLIVDGCVFSTSTVSQPDWTARDETTNTHPWLISMMAWLQKYWSLTTNILLIKSELKLESRASAVHVAMSPRNLGGKYRCRPNIGSLKYACHFWHETERVHRTAPRLSLSVWRQLCRSVVCVKAEFLSHTAFSYKNGEFYTTMTYPCLNRSVCLSTGSSPTWWKFGLFHEGVPSCSDDAMHRSCTNFKCDVEKKFRKFVLN